MLETTRVKPLPRKIEAYQRDWIAGGSEVPRRKGGHEVGAGIGL